MTILGVILAAIFTVTFESVDTPGTFPGSANAVIEGLRFSPNCSARVVTPKEWLTIESSYLVVDDSNNCGEHPNPESIDHSSLRIDRQGAPFDFLGLTARGNENWIQYAIWSSEGHFLNAEFGVLNVYWPGVLWIAMGDNSDSFHNGHGYDDIRYSVDEPATSWLIGIAGLLVFGFSRKMKWQ